MLKDKSSSSKKGSPLVVLVAVMAAALPLALHAEVFEATVDDVVSLTNALTQMNELTDAGRKNARIWLRPGTYNLSGICMYSSDTYGKGHLAIGLSQGGMIAGLGDGPEDTILLGAGAAEQCRVLVLKGGGGNQGYFTVSNLTVTGGYTPKSGGGIYNSSLANTQKLSHLIVSNNYAGGSGGGCHKARAEYCLFADNKADGGGTSYGGGLYTEAGGGQTTANSNIVIGCTFVSNSCLKGMGGALLLRGKCHDCTFIGNSSVHGGAICVDSVFPTLYGGKITNETMITGAKFIGNTLNAYGYGSAVYNKASSGLVKISDSTFAANNVTNFTGPGVVYKGDLHVCTITNNIRAGSIFSSCDLDRCYVADNLTKANQGVVDSGDGANLNVNCVFKDNVNEGYGHISHGKRIVNCTYIGNVITAGANYGGICTKCQMWNTILYDNYLRADKDAYYNSDVRAHNANGDLTLVMTNCFFGKCDSYTLLDASGFVTNNGCASTRKVADFKFENASGGAYTPTIRSPAYDAGCSEGWLLALAGLKDLAGNERVFGAAIDIGAYESQKRKPGVMLIVW